MGAFLELERIQATARLGVTEAERARPQEIEVGLRLEFAELPSACESDRIEDTVCYGGLAERVTALCGSREFALIEHLAYLLRAEVARLAGPEARVGVRVRKLHAPVPSLRGGAVFGIDP